MDQKWWVFEGGNHPLNPKFFIHIPLYISKLPPPLAIMMTHLYNKSLSDIHRFCVEGLPKKLYFGYFVLIWWKIDKNQEILKQSCKDLLIWTKLPIVWLIVGSDNIFNIEVNRALDIHVIVHNSLTQNQNRLKSWI